MVTHTAATAGSGTAGRTKRVLIVNHCGLLLPSGTVRAMQYKELFDRSPAWSAKYTSRKSELLVRILHNPERVRWQIFSAMFHRVLDPYSRRWHARREDEIVERAADFDIVYVVKSPGGSRFYRRLSEIRGTRTVIDASDAICLPIFNWDDLPGTLERVHGVICESEFVAEYVRQHNANVVVVPDAPQLAHFDRVRSEVRRDPQRLTIGWIGSSINIGPLYRLIEPLEALFATHRQLHLRIVGASQSRLPSFENVSYSCRASYNQEEMVREVLNFDIGLLPLFRNMDGKARGTLKAKVYMSGEAVAVCEDYGENPNLIQNGINGVLADSQSDWHDKLEWLITHPTERMAIARNGLNTIRANFTTEQMFAKLVAAFDEILGKS
jgi:glycosyltransferase involved in cell wall biosynthesis